jgi:hypothetical protein
VGTTCIVVHDARATHGARNHHFGRRNNPYNPQKAQFNIAPYTSLFLVKAGRLVSESINDVPVSARCFTHFNIPTNAASNN